MHESFLIAMDALRQLPGKKLHTAEIRVEEIISLKYEMETFAGQKGYSQACKRYIPTCGGECCKWHFPKHLTPGDFFVAVFRMPKEEQALLTKLILNSGGDQCPLLLETGCSLSFEQRPVVCTNAYPCFNDRSYWEKKEKMNTRFVRAFDALSAILEHPW